MVVYNCGSPVRGHVTKAMAEGSKAQYEPNAEPRYQGGDSIVWGLIRGAPRIIKECKKSGANYWQMDNAYIGKNKYYRVTKNAFQLTELTERPPDRWKKIADKYHVKLRPWRKEGYILFSLSTPHLYAFHGFEYDKYVKETIETLQKHTSRKIVVRPKDANISIEDQLQDAFALVTHSSATGLDALQWGVPVFTTGPCAANPCALQDLSKIESPIYPEREPLFRSLAYGQFTVEEMSSGYAWEMVC